MFGGSSSASSAFLQKTFGFMLCVFEEVKLSPLQLLHSCMPWMGAITVLSAIALEDWQVAFQQIQMRHCMAIGISSLCGMLANVSSTWVLGLTSPLAHILLGQLKTILILLGGYLFFDKEPTGRSLFGAVLALSSITLYAWSKIPKEEGVRVSPEKDEVDEELGMVGKEKG